MNAFLSTLLANAEPKPEYPPAFTTVVVTLDRGYEAYAVWTGRVWRARGGEVSIKSWRYSAVKVTSLEHASAA